MTDKKETFIPCVVRLDNKETTQPANLVVAESLKRLSDEDLKELGLVSESAKPVSESDLQTVRTTSGMIDATISVIVEQIGNIDLESEMLVLRKRALKRRLRILQRLSKSLQTDQGDQRTV